jgi:hypothetical protein
MYSSLKGVFDKSKGFETAKEKEKSSWKILDGFSPKMIPF